MTKLSFIQTLGRRWYPDFNVLRSLIRVESLQMRLSVHAHCDAFKQQKTYCNFPSQQGSQEIGAYSWQLRFGHPNDRFLWIIGLVKTWSKVICTYLYLDKDNWCGGKRWCRRRRTSCIDICHWRRGTTRSSCSCKSCSCHRARVFVRQLGRSADRSRARTCRTSSHVSGQGMRVKTLVGRTEW